MRDRLSPSYSPIFIKHYGATGGAFYRVHVGKVSGEEAAEKFGQELRSREGVVPMVIRLDENSPNTGEIQ
ncbi:MAG: SPOR domain-containing protein [Acidobacteriota bacterium]|nr:SPOR domain-containing protein [Acidobacteriota bacterium]